MILRYSQSAVRDAWAWCAPGLLLALLAFGSTAAWAAGPPSGDWLGDVITAHGVGIGLLAVFVGGLALKDWYPMMPHASVWCVTELIKRTEMDRLVETLKGVA